MLQMQRGRQGDSMIYEAVINGDEAETIDPVRAIIVEQESGNTYRYRADEITHLLVRKRNESKVDK